METKNNTNANKSRKAIRIVISILVAIALWSMWTGGFPWR